LDLLLKKQEKGPHLKPNHHIVWVNNLFSSIRLFKRLREEGIGAAGTIRTSRTKRKKGLAKALKQSGAGKGLKKQLGVVKKPRGRPKKLTKSVGNLGNSIQNSPDPYQNPCQNLTQDLAQNLPTPEPSQEPLQEPSQEPIGITGN